MEMLINLVQEFVHIILHLDLYLNDWMTTLGPAIYILLFMVIFAETGLVVAPFLPGDSFLFALGALTAVDQAFLDFNLLFVLLIVAAILGDAVNYAIGKYLGPKIFSRDTGLFLNKAHLMRAHAFYEKHGGKTVIIARFAPIIRTFAPFVAGIGKMQYRRFAIYNVVGAFLWVGIFLSAGRFFGNLPQVKSNFHIVIVAIIILSFLPIVIEYWKGHRASRQVVRS